jgi:hypothetical protein
VALATPETRSGLAPVLAEAAAEGRRRAGLQSPPPEWSEARIEILDRIDPTSSTTGPGPWAGMVGERGRSSDRLPPVTGIEGLARCPWRELLVRRLGLSPMPDPRLGMPDTGGPLLGSLVHEVLQRIVDRVSGRRGLALEDLRDAEPVEVAWPDPEALGEIVFAAARQLARREGIASAGMARLLTAQAEPYLEVARRGEWGEDGVLEGCVAAEISSEVVVEGVPEPLRFRADRVDRGADGFELLDYKSSRPAIEATTEKARVRRLRDNVAHGRLLQGVAYALAADGGSGRYLYLRPELGTKPESIRNISVSGEDAELVSLFQAAAVAATEAWHAGSMFPRVEDPKGKAWHCDYCPVAEACLRSDSAYRRRIRDWAAAEGQAATSIEEIGRRLWWLGEERPGAGS